MAEWDVFLSHAHEDKATVVEPLAEGLRNAGLRVWLDSQELTIGDSLRRKIEEGLIHSRFGVVVLSPSFLRKEWPQRELEAILALEQRHGKRLLPVIHEIEFSTLVDRAPLLADKIGVSTSEGIAAVVAEILRAMGMRTDVTTAERPTDSSTALPGTEIGTYRLETCIGSGGSGVVYAATDSRRRQRVAVKIFFPLRRGLRHLSGLFDRGFRALSAIRHPNVVSAFDHGSVVVDGVRRSFLVTELIKGLPLDDWAARSEDTEASYLERLSIASKLASALVACHQATYVDEIGFQVRGVLHGDIKPANVLIDDDSAPHLLDFLQLDVQRLIDPRIVDPELLSIEPKMATGAMGTPGFMAPEQERHGVITQATDIYGLGITLPYLFTRPEASNPLYDFLGRRGLPSELTHLVEAAISPDPAGRPRSMEDVASTLSSLYEREKERLGRAQRA